MRKKVWAVIAWGGGIRYVNQSIFDTKKEAEERLREYASIPELKEKSKKNKVVKAELRWCESDGCDGKNNVCSECVV